jgi:flagellin FlaB
MLHKFVKNEKGFTGLEAAIVLIAFVVVAAVFSYVMLSAGFFTTQKSQEVVHTGVTQASSSLELSGDVVATSDAAVAPATPTRIQTVNLCLELTSGGSPVDMSKTLIVFTAPAVKPVDLTLNTAAIATTSATNFAIIDRFNDNNNLLMERGEKFEVRIDLTQVANAVTFGPNSEFQLEVKPPQGAIYTIYRHAPPAITPIMTLY